MHSRKHLIRHLYLHCRWRPQAHSTPFSCGEVFSRLATILFPWTSRNHWFLQFYTDHHHRLYEVMSYPAYYCAAWQSSSQPTSKHLYRHTRTNRTVEILLFINGGSICVGWSLIRTVYTTRRSSSSHKAFWPSTGFSNAVSDGASSARIYSSHNALN